MNKKLTILSIIFTILIIISVILIINDKKKEIVSIPNNQNNQTETVEAREENKEILNIDDKKIEPTLPIISKKQEDIILFYGEGCPHCAIVEEFIEENKIDTKISFSKKEVYYNKQNSSLLVEKAKICNFNTDSIGVPFLWDGARCLVGDQDIIEFFKLKADI